MDPYATAIADQTNAMIAIATSQAGLASAVATQQATSRTTVSADALQIATVIGPGLAPLTPLFWALTLFVLWFPIRQILRWFGVIPRLR